jgi:hypothetical protein
MEMLACEACAVDIAFSFATGHRKPSVAPFPEGFDFKGHQCFTACFTHRSILDMPPPDDWRPQRNHSPHDSFLMDFEGEVLRALSDAPRGPLRHLQPRWAIVVRNRVDPYHTDVTWAEYVDWVVGGGGDAWFQDVAEANPQAV